MNATTTAYFARTDNRPPPGVRPMVVRRHAQRYYRSYLIDLETSCGAAPPYVAGSVRISLWDAREDNMAPIAIRRMGVDSWREAMDEMVALEDTLKEDT